MILDIGGPDDAISCCAVGSGRHDAYTVDLLPLPASKIHLYDLRRREVHQARLLHMYAGSKLPKGTWKQWYEEAHRVGTMEDNLFFSKCGDDDDLA